MQTWTNFLVSCISVEVEENLWLKEEAQEPEGISLLLIFLWVATKHDTTENLVSLCFFCVT